MSVPHESRSLTELIGGLANDITSLFRKEIELAKAEASEKAASALKGIELIAAGGILALGALGVILAAAVTALAALFQRMGMGQTGSNSLAALIIAIVIAVIAWILISRGLAQLKGNNLKLERTTSSLSRDAAVVKERL